MSLHIGERGWSFSGSGWTPTWTPLTREVASAVHEIEAESWQRTIFGYESFGESVLGGWREFRMSEQLRRRRSRINGRYIVSDAQW